MSKGSHARCQDLDSAIRRVIASFDSFDRPVPEEALERLFQRPQEEIRAALDRLRAAGAIETGDGLCHHPGKSWEIRRWERDQACFRSRLPELRLAAVRLARVPFVRGILLVGEASAGCLRPGEGFDFFVITAKDRVWLCRRLANRLVRKPGRMRGLAWLESAQYMSDATLTLPVRNENTALEFAFSRILYNPAVCRKFLEANAWIRNWYQPLADQDAAIPGFGGGFWKKMLERVFDLFWNSKWEQRLLRARSAEIKAADPEARRAFGKHASPVFTRQEVPRFQGGWLSRVHSTPRAPRSGIRTRLALLKGMDAKFAPRLVLAHAEGADGNTPCEPLGLMAAAAIWKRAGLAVRLHDAWSADPESLARVLLDETPALALIYATSRSREQVFALIRECRFLRNPVLVCGPDALPASAAYLDAGADGVVAGEPEQTVLELLQAMIKPGMPAAHEIAGWSAGERHMAWRPPLADPGNWPAPDRDILDQRPYLRTWKKRHGFSCLHVAPSRGCPAQCAWCSRADWESAARLRPAKSVAAEMRRLRARHGAERIWLLDDLALAHPAWVAELGQALKGARIAFECMLHPVNADPAMLRVLREAGCAGIWMDAGAASPRLLARMRRAATAEQVRRAAAMVKETGIPLGVHLQLGIPGERPEDIEATRLWLRDVRPDFCDLAMHRNIRADSPYRRAYGPVLAASKEERGPFSRRLQLLQAIALRTIPLAYRRELRPGSRLQEWKLRLLQAAYRFLLAVNTVDLGRPMIADSGKKPVAPV